MVAIIGILVVIGSVLGGFMMANGPIHALVVPSEYVIIGGTSVGTMLISTPRTVLASIAGKLKGVLAANPFNQGYYLTALNLQYELFQLARKDGLVALEAHIERPEESKVFQKYPEVLARHHAVSFLCDSLRLVLVGSVPPHDLEQLMESEIEVHHEEEEKSVTALTKVADALPAIGIVAAVLGIVVTMQSIAGPIEEIGHHVAAALVGTFLGVLLSYGFVHPIASNIEALNQAEGRFLSVIKAGVVAFAKGLAPIICVEFARRAIFAGDRPTFQVMEDSCKGLKGKVA